jgi:hypothetical protein
MEPAPKIPFAQVRDAIRTEEARVNWIRLCLLCSAVSTGHPLSKRCVHRGQGDIRRSIQS